MTQRPPSAVEPRHAAIIEAAREHRAAGRAVDALALLEVVLADEPACGQALHEKGLALGAAGRLAEAQACLAEAAIGDPANPDRYVDLADVSEVLGQPATVLPAYRRALALAPDRADLAYRLGLLLMGRGRHRDAERCLCRALALKGAYPEAQVARGVACHKEGRLREAVTLFRDAVVRSPDYTPGFVALGVALREAGASPDQVASVERIAAEREPGRAAIVLPVVQHYRDIGEEAEACRLATALIERQMAAAERDEIGVHGIRVLMPDDLVARIGEMAHQLDLHVKMKRLGWLPDFVSVLVAPQGRTANRSFLDHWRRHMTVVDDPALIERIEPLKQRIAFDPVYVRMPDGRALSKNRVYHAVQAEWQRRSLGPLLDLTRGEVERGRAALRRLGVPADAWFACLHVRESGYLKESASSSEAARNADVRSYIPAIAAIARRGGWVVRLGDPSMAPLPPMPGVIDYALSGERSEEMDVYLAASCRFMLGTTSGMMLVAATFGVPVAAANFFPPGERLASASDLYMPKLVRERSTGRLLSFDECLPLPLGLTYDARRFSARGLELIDNDPADILSMAEEMLDRVDGRMVYDAEDDALQQRIDDLLPPLGRTGVRTARAFLRRHRHLFRA